ncbi:non-ribosomal peptide synthetase, partial [Nocardiopsis salina]|uniref:non-ribosomal peptide synthetase n=1 Tax=Nocardiopsis salina TaxID=245836 RepID=UPI001376E39E
MLSAQSGVWAAQEIDSEGSRFNCGGYIRMRGPVSYKLLKDAVRRALEETEALRVRFGDGWQWIEGNSSLGLEYLDLGGTGGSAEKWMTSDMSRAVDLRTDTQSVRHVLIRESDGSYIFYLRYHHIVMDGFGQNLYLKRISDIYTALVSGEELKSGRSAALAELVADDQEYRASLTRQTDQEYWSDLMSDRDSLPTLSRSIGGGRSGVLRRVRELGDTQSRALRDLASQCSSTPSAVLLSVVGAYACRVTTRTETILNLPVPARVSRAARSTPAMLANEVPLPVDAPGDHTFIELVEEVTARLREVMQHQRYRGEDLHADLGLAGTRQSIAGVTVNCMNLQGRLAFGEVQATVHQLSAGPVRDLSLNFLMEHGGASTTLVMDAVAERYTPEDLKDHEERLFVLLGQCLAEPDRPLKSFSLMGVEEERAVLAAGHGPVRDYPVRPSLGELIGAQARRTPGAVAAQVEGDSLTYEELLERAWRLAAHLRSHGAGPGETVGVCDTRSLDLIVELLAVVLSGAAYVPIDPDLPPSRVSFLAQDAEVCVLLGNSEILGGFPALADRAIAVDRIIDDLPQASTRTCDASPEDTAYVIYTSGSTGRPKGVAIPHRGVVNRLMWMQEKHNLGPGSTVLQKTPFTFDVSVWEFFWPLLVGARLHLAPPAAHRDPKMIADIVRRHQVDVLHFVPSMLDRFLAEPSATNLGSLRHVIASGEALSAQTVEHFHRLHATGDAPVRLHNLYGPTEASVDVTHWECVPDESATSVPIGSAVPNTALYVLDAYGAPVPFGVAGELCIAGTQVATGYLNQDDVTKRSFGANPFGPGTLYRTGDAAIMEPGGVLHFLGRLDSQIKIRGMRVEPGEIESVLLSHPDVAQAVILAPKDVAGGHRLLAHVVPRGKSTLTSENVLAHAGQHLPEHMVPDAVGVTTEFPTLTSGKIDRKTLASLSVEVNAPVGSPTLPAGDVEQRLHDIWTDVLGLETIDVNSSVFALGADSMHCIRARSTMERYGLTCSVAEIFEAPTIRSLALVVRATEGGRTPDRTQPFDLLSQEDRALLPQGVVDAYPLSRMQFGILYHADQSENTSVYRVVVSIEVPLPLDEQHLRAALRATTGRHPALRTSYHLSGYSHPLQAVHGAVEVPLESSDALLGRGRDEQRERLQHWVEAAKHQDFDLTCAPLLRFTAHRLHAASFQLSVVEHHVVLDGWSDAGMMNEIVERYRARLLGEELRLSSVASTYRDFVAAERRSENDRSHQEFWLQELSGMSHRLLPRTIPAHRSTAPGHHRHTVPLPQADTRQLFSVAQEAGLPVKAVCAALHLAVMGNFHAGEDVLTGVVANTRLEEPGGDEAIGVFLNTLPLGVRMGDATWLDLAHEVHAWERRVAPHRRYPYAKIREDHEDLELDSYVNFMDFHRQLSFDPARANSLGAADTNFPLAVNFLIDADRKHLDLWLDCDTAQLDQSLRERLVHYYLGAVRAFLAQPSANVRDVRLSPHDEESRLGEWCRSTVTFDQDATIGSLIAEQAARTPTAVAVRHSEEQLTYAQLMGAADSALLRLRHSGVGPGGRVGLNLTRGLDLMVMLVAVTRSGAAYVPLDPDFPTERLRHIAEDAELDCLITDSGEGEKLPARTIIRWEGRRDHNRPDQPGPVLASATPTDPLYILYTSGSTGAPKGAQVSHRNLVNLFAGMNQRIGMGSDDAVLALTSVSFDISTVELLWPLCQGATVVMADTGLIGRLEPGDGPDSFAELCLREKVTLVQATPSFMAVVAS